MGREIVFVTGRNPARGRGGGSSYVRAHMRAAMQAGFEPHVFCIDARNGVSDEAFGTVHRVVPPFPLRRSIASPDRPRGFFAHWLAGFALSPYSAALHARRLAAAIERFLRGRPGPHLIHGFYTWGCVGLDVRARLARTGTEIVVVNSVYTTARHEARAKTRGAGANLFHRAVFRAERLWIDAVVRRQERRACSQSRLVLLNYDSVRRLLLAEHGAGTEMRKTPYSAETAFTRHGPAPQPRSTAEDKAPLIVAVSRHDPRKGIDVLLRALSALRAEGVLFRARFVSGGPLLAAHRRLADRLGLADVATFTGWVSDPAPHLQRADVFVLPSLQEGSGSIALLEALQAGLAIVATNVDGIPEDVVDGESALLVAPGDADAMRRALARTLTDAALRAKLRRRARETFDQRFTAEAFSAALGGLYAELGIK
jgi:glycosyltransferase involved in cell wall biosynthesis